MFVIFHKKEEDNKLVLGEKNWRLKRFQKKRGGGVGWAMVGKICNRWIFVYLAQNLVSMETLMGWRVESSGSLKFVVHSLNSKKMFILQTSQFPYRKWPISLCSTSLLWNGNIKHDWKNNEKRCQVVTSKGLWTNLFNEKHQAFCTSQCKMLLGCKNVTMDKENWCEKPLQGHQDG